MSDAMETRGRTAASASIRSGGDGEEAQGEALADKLSAFADAAGDRVAENIETAKQKAAGTAQQQRAAGAEKIKEIARSVHGVGDSLESELPQASRLIHDAAAALERASATLRERSVEDLVADVGKFARAQPAAFFGAAVLAGFAVARFLKSSANAPASPSNPS